MSAIIIPFYMLDQFTPALSGPSIVVVKTKAFTGGEAEAGSGTSTSVVFCGDLEGSSYQTTITMFYKQNIGVTDKRLSIKLMKMKKVKVLHINIKG